MSFIPKNSNETQKRSYFLGEIAIAIGVISIGEIAIAISSISMIAIDADRCDRDRDRCRSAQFRWLARSRSWCVGVDRSVWLGVWVEAVKVWQRQCVCERLVRVRERRKSFEVKITAENDFSRFWLNFRSNWKHFQFDRILHTNQMPYFLENDFRKSISVKTNGALVTKITCFAQIGQFLNVFNFPLNISDCSLSSPFQTSLKLTRSLSKNLHFYIISTSFFKKRYGFSYYLIAFHVYSMCFLDFYVVVWVLWHMLFMYGMGLLY